MCYNLTIMSFCPGDNTNAPLHPVEFIMGGICLVAIFSAVVYLAVDSLRGVDLGLFWYALWH